MKHAEAIERLKGRFMTVSMCATSAEAKAENEAIDMAIAALRAEEEREKGCEACSESRHILHAYLDELDEAIRVFIEGDTLYLRGEGWQTSRKIHACPMCGRKLDGGGKDG